MSVLIVSVNPSLKIAFTCSKWGGGELEFNVPFQHKHGYIRNECSKWNFTSGNQTCSHSLCDNAKIRPHLKSKVTIIYAQYTSNTIALIHIHTDLLLRALVMCSRKTTV